MTADVHAMPVRDEAKFFLGQSLDSDLGIGLSGCLELGGMSGVETALLGYRPDMRK